MVYLIFRMYLQFDWFSALASTLKCSLLSPHDHFVINLQQGQLSHYKLYTNTHTHMPTLCVCFDRQGLAIQHLIGHCKSLYASLWIEAPRTLGTFWGKTWVDVLFWEESISAFLIPVKLNKIIKYNVIEIKCNVFYLFFLPEKKKN